jgi:hypothetical protein
MLNNKASRRPARNTWLLDYPAALASFANFIPKALLSPNLRIIEVVFLFYLIGLYCIIIIVSGFWVIMNEDSVVHVMKSIGGEFYASQDSA